MWAAIERLRRERTATEMQEMFVTESIGMLEYSDLSTFFGGLEAKIGAPDPKIREAMAAEHTAAGGDRHEEFTTGNYELRTTSATEWAFVATPEATPAGGWPKEQKLIKAHQPARLLCSFAQPSSACLWSARQAAQVARGGRT